MPITYDPSGNRITVDDYPESSPCSFQDIYDADKAGQVDLVSRSVTGTDTDPVDNTYPLRPADEKVLGGTKHDLYIVVENWSGFTDATIRLIGHDESGNDQTEDIVVTGDGTYYSAELWTDLPQTQVISVNGTGSFDYRLVQGQWGVVSRFSPSQFMFECALQVGPSNETWLIDTDKHILHTVSSDFLALGSHGHLRLGSVIDPDKRTTTAGCCLYTTTSGKNIIDAGANSTIELYSSTVSAPSETYINFQSTTVSVKFWNTSFYRMRFTGYTPLADVSHMSYSDATYGPIGNYTYGFDILITKVTYAAFFAGLTGQVTVRNLRTDHSENLSFMFYYSSAEVFAINVDWKWKNLFFSSAGSKLWRQYTFNLRVVDETGSPISGARVRLFDKDNSLVLDTTTDAEGRISEFTISMGYYTPEGFTTLSPYTLYVTHPKYRPYSLVFTPSAPIDWIIPLTFARVTTDQEVLP